MLGYQDIFLYEVFMNKKELKDKLFELNIPVYDGRRIKKIHVKAITGMEITGSVISLEFVQKVIDALKNAVKSKKEPNIEKLNDFVKKYASGTLMDFAKAAVDYFKQGKLKWENEFGLLQNEYQPGGFEVIPWSWLKRQFEDITPEVEKRLPRAFTQQKVK